MSRGSRLVVLAFCAVLPLLAAPAAAATTQGPPDEPPVDWTLLDESMRIDPAAIVAAITKNVPLSVTITKETPAGPVFESVPVASAASAQKVIAAAQKRDGVLAVGMDQKWSVAANDTYRYDQWVLNRWKPEKYIWPKAQGSGYRVAVIDTGVAAGHPDLKGRVTAGYDFVQNRWGQTDHNGHGTHVAGIIAATVNNYKGIAGLAPKASILPVRVLDENGSGYTSDIARGITWAAQHSAKVINLSLVACDSDSAVKSAVAYARSKGILVVAAAGNAPCGLLGNSPAYPAAYYGVLGVASVEKNLVVSSFSYSGSWVDVAAPGGDILSTMIRDNRVGCGWAAYCSMSGTSMATPHVSAEAILIYARKKYGGNTLANRIIGTATDLGPKGRDNDYGYGYINPIKAIG